MNLNIVYEAINKIIVTLFVFFQLIAEKLFWCFYRPTPHVEVYIELQEFENLFKDSGYFDFFLLAFYDYFFRIYFIYSFFFITDYLISEKASWILGSSLFGLITNLFFTKFTSLLEFFNFIIFIFLTCIFLFCFTISIICLF